MLFIKCDRCGVLEETITVSKPASDMTLILEREPLKWAQMHLCDECTQHVITFIRMGPGTLISSSRSAHKSVPTKRPTITRV